MYIAGLLSCRIYQAFYHLFYYVFTVYALDCVHSTILYFFPHVCSFMCMSPPCICPLRMSGYSYASSLWVCITPGVYPSLCLVIHMYIFSVYVSLRVYLSSVYMSLLVYVPSLCKSNLVYVHRIYTPLCINSTACTLHRVYAPPCVHSTACTLHYVYTPSYVRFNLNMFLLCVYPLSEQCLGRIKYWEVHCN